MSIYYKWNTDKLYRNADYIDYCVINIPIQQIHTWSKQNINIIKLNRIESYFKNTEEIDIPIINSWNSRRKKFILRDGNHRTICMKNHKYSHIPVLIHSNLVKYVKVRKESPNVTDNEDLPDNFSD